MKTSNDIDVVSMYNEYGWVGCARCWRIAPDVDIYSGLTCSRCHEVLSKEYPDILLRQKQQLAAELKSFIDVHGTTSIGIRPNKETRFEVFETTDKKFQIKEYGDGATINAFIAKFAA